MCNKVQFNLYCFAGSFIFCYFLIKVNIVAYILFMAAGVIMFVYDTVWTLEVTKQGNFNHITERAVEERL